MEFTDFTQLSSLESLIQYFSQKCHHQISVLPFSFYKKEYLLKLNHQIPSVTLNMFESIGHNESSLESRIARIFKIDDFYIIKSMDSLDIMSEELLRTLFSAILLAGNFRGTIFGSLKSDMILGMEIDGKEISRVLTFKPSESMEASPESRIMRLIEISIPALTVTTPLRKMMLEQNKRVHWFPWTGNENPIESFRMQFLWPSTAVGVDSEVNLDLLETAPIWFLSLSTFDRTETETAFSNIQQIIDDAQETREHVRFMMSEVTDADNNWSTSALLNLLSRPVNFMEDLTKTLGLCLSYSAETKNFTLMASFWRKFVEHLRNCFQDLQPIFTSSPEEIFDIHAHLIHQKLVLLDYSIKKELQYQALHSRPSSSREKHFQGRKFLQTVAGNCDSGSQNDFIPSQSTGRDYGRKCKLSDEMLLDHPDVPIWVPVSQDPGFRSTDMAALYELTLMDDSVNDEVKTRLRSEQLVSDIQAFKAANNLAVFEDFIRWYSPKDWNGLERILSKRMAEGNNLWRTLWDSARPVLACDQDQIFDPFLEGERCLHFFENISIKEICSLVNENYSEIFRGQLESIRIQMKVPEISAKNLDEFANILSVHYFVSLEFPRISDRLRSSIVREKENQIIVGEDDDRNVIIQHLNETNWALEKDEVFFSTPPTSYVLKIPGELDYESRIVLIE